MSGFSGMFNRLSGQPESYERKARYRIGKTLGAGTYGIVREAESPDGRVAVKMILKKNVKGSEQMVYDELYMLQQLHHPHIVRFVDWFESRDKFYIVTQLATGGELFDRICERGKFTEKDASQTMRQVIEAVDYLHDRNVVHRDLKPENLLYLSKDPDSSLVLADFGIAKMLENKNEVLTTVAGSFGYAAPEVMMRMGHGKPVDMWSLGVITYTLLCGYSPFRSESMADLIDECKSGRVEFHQKYWKGVSNDAKDFIRALLNPDPNRRPTSKEALRLRWLTGMNATDHDLVKELRSRRIKDRLRLGIERVKLAQRIEMLKRQENLEADADNADIPADSSRAADEALASRDARGISPARPGAKARLSRAAKADIFRAVVLAKTKEMRQERERENLEKDAKRASLGS